MEKSKKRTAIALVILTSIIFGSFSRIAHIENIRTVDMLFLIAGGICIGALVSTVVQKSRQ